MKGIDKKMAGALTLGVLLMINGNLAGAAPALPPASDDAGTQLRNQQEQMEQERIRRELEEAQKSKVGQVTEQAPEEQVQSSTVKFTLQKVMFDESAVLPKAELQQLAEPYLGKEVSLDNIYDITKEINKMYSDAGYLTCRAYIGEQTIHDGVVKISLLEGRTGEMDVTGIKHTRPAYITDRLGLHPGKIQNINELNHDLFRFNVREDVPLRIVLKPGKETGTTDYAIEAQEPKNNTVSLYADNAGSLTTGIWREGIFYTNRSLSDNRDALTLSYMHAIGMHSGSASYNRSLGHSGTKMELSASRNDTKGKNAVSRSQGLKGQASFVGATFIQPLVTRPTVRSEARLGYSHQSSETEIYNVKWIDNSANDYTLGYQLTTFGKNSALFQRHEYVMGRNHAGGLSGTYSGSRQDYGAYHLNSLYQHAQNHGQLWSVRFNAQWSSTKGLPSSEQFFLGGSYTVRGYHQDVVSGDHGILTSFEYGVPLTSKRNVSAYGFFDYGSLMQSSKANSDYILASTGFGIRAMLKQQYSLNVVLGVPLRREINGENHSKTRLHLSFNGQF